MSEHQGISVTNQCYDCMLIDTLCDNCQDLADARLSEKAYEIIENGGDFYYRKEGKAQVAVASAGAMGERNCMSFLSNEPSGHDWTERDGEFKLPIVFLQDGGELDNLWELQDYTQSKRETVCPWCQLLTPKIFNECQDCDKPLERNVR